MAGRNTPLIRPMTIEAAAMAAPVEPPDTSASAPFEATNRAAVSTEEPGLSLTALAGWSCISTTSGAWTTGRSAPTAFSSGSTTSSRPTSTTS